MRDDLFNNYNSSPYLNIYSLGITPQGQNLTVFNITDPSVDDEGKKKVYIIAQQHSGETASSYVAEGLIHLYTKKEGYFGENWPENGQYDITENETKWVNLTLTKKPPENSSVKGYITDSKTGDPIQIPAANVPKFTAGKALKKAVK